MHSGAIDADRMGTKHTLDLDYLILAQSGSIDTPHQATSRVINHTSQRCVNRSAKSFGHHAWQVARVIDMGLIQHHRAQLTKIDGQRRPISQSAAPSIPETHHDRSKIDPGHA